MNSRSGTCALALAMLAVATPALGQTPGQITRESVDALGGGPFSQRSFGQAGKAAVSADGRVIAFQSDASDLVPGDTNQATDVFVRDRATGVLQRVSMTWNGMEGRGDSKCPSLSADGRWVAFASRAWNMVPGGANLGHPRWDVYVHDRQASATTRVSVSASGGDPDGDSECPSISGDGQRVVFASAAANLASDDDNQVKDVFLRDRADEKTVLVSKGGGRTPGDSQRPVISGDGRFVAFESSALDLVPGQRFARETAFDRAAPHVYVRDLSDETTELVSIGGARTANGPSTFPSISADGRYVAFTSRATNLVAPALHNAFERAYVRDRRAGTVWLAAPIDPLQSDCGRDGVPLHCQDGIQGPHAISADGRFVAFSSRSLLHLPANTSHGDQIFLFDNLGRRLRRLSVDATGFSGSACSWSPALSGDGSVLAYSSKSVNLVPDGPAELEPGQVGLFSQLRGCDDAGRCQPIATCPAEPATSCVAATSSLLRLRKHAPGSVNPDELFWRWSAAAAKDPFPSPAAGARYQVCVYADTLALDTAAPAAPSCSDAARPCWRSFASGYKLLDPQGGITDLTVSSSARSRRISLHGKGALLDAPYLPLNGGKGIVVQLHDSGSGRCWGTAFPASAITRNVAGVAATGSRRDGWLVAEIR